MEQNWSKFLWSHFSLARDYFFHSSVVFLVGTFLTWKIDVGKIAPFRCIHVKRSIENGDSGSCSIYSLHISRRSYYTVKPMNSLNDHWSYHGAIQPITLPFSYLLILLWRVSCIISSSSSNSLVIWCNIFYCSIWKFSMSFHFSSGQSRLSKEWFYL